MRGARSIYRRFLASTRGLAAIEFAIVLPVLLIMLLATYDAGNAIATYMKVRSATFTLAAITNQFSRLTPIQSTDMQAITGATAAVLAPYSSAPAIVTITQVKQTICLPSHSKLELFSEWDGLLSRHDVVANSFRRLYQQCLRQLSVLADIRRGGL